MLPSARLIPVMRPPPAEALLPEERQRGKGSGVLLGPADLGDRRRSSCGLVLDQLVLETRLHGREHHGVAFLGVGIGLGAGQGSAHLLEDQHLSRRQAPDIAPQRRPGGALRQAAFVVTPVVERNCRLVGIDLPALQRLEDQGPGCQCACLFDGVGDARLELRNPRQEPRAGFDLRRSPSGGATCT